MCCIILCYCDWFWFLFLPGVCLLVFPIFAGFMLLQHGVLPGGMQMLDWFEILFILDSWGLGSFHVKCHSSKHGHVSNHRYPSEHPMLAFRIDYRSVGWTTAIPQKGTSEVKTCSKPRKKLEQNQCNKSEKTMTHHQKHFKIPGFWPTLPYTS